MTDIVLRIYDYLHRHTGICVSALCITTALLAGLVCRTDFNEDISAFLPLGDEYRESMQVYQDVSGASNLLAIFQSKDTTEMDADNLVCSMNDYGRFLSETDTLSVIRETIRRTDYDKMTETAGFLFRNIPLFLTEKDYLRFDSLLDSPSFLENQLQEDLSALMFPSSGITSAHLEKDPLNLFTPVVSELLRNAGTSDFELYDGYIFTKDWKRGIIVQTSPYGNSETRSNAQLMKMLGAVADSVEAHNPSVTVHYTGGPAIAVGNSNQIRQDCMVSVTVAVLLILALLYYAFRSPGNILLIVLSIAWGWLFALGVLSVFRQSVSMIVVGISSIIVGIAVNYPLHLIAHAGHTRNMRQTLREIVSPLVIGNITTVGAFCALIPLQAAALRDLGVFSALLLVGTILFVMLWLPHIVRVREEDTTHSTRLLDWVANLPIEKNRWGIVLIGALTLVFGWFSSGTRFDANIGHLNYMAPEQRADKEYLQQLTSAAASGRQCLYVVSKGSSVDEALERSGQIHSALNRIAGKYPGTEVASCHRFLCSKEEQERRIRRWESFVGKYARLLGPQLAEKAAEAGFSGDAFAPFHDIINGQYHGQDFAYFRPLKDLYAAHISTDSLTGTYRVVDAVTVKSAYTETVRKEIKAVLPEGAFCFDIESMNRELAGNLTDNFNYVGWACAAIVFLFLWFSFRRFRLALLTFLPMTVSWIWILGIMGLMGIQFNMVNIILATFIFGQGDDYTIFITEGCLQEYTCGRKVLTSHKRSVALSALIMFVGIGSLILARHPALHSLAEVTIVGMFSVVLMAYVIPPLLFSLPPFRGTKTHNP